MIQPWSYCSPLVFGCLKTLGTLFFSEGRWWGNWVEGWWWEDWRWGKEKVQSGYNTGEKTKTINHQQNHNVCIIYINYTLGRSEASQVVGVINITTMKLLIVLRYKFQECSVSFFFLLCIFLRFGVCLLKKKKRKNSRISIRTFFNNVGAYYPSLPTTIFHVCLR